MVSIEPALLHRLLARAQGARWAVTAARFEIALARSLEKAFPAETPDATRMEKYLRALHLEDLALACACEDGHEGAWEHFVREFRPPLYRAASAIDPTGGARELADALYADLFGVKERDGVRQSLLRYFHGRSSLGTWLRSVLSQRHVDSVRAARRLDPLSEERADEIPAAASIPGPDRARHAAALATALAAAIEGLAARDRLRLACYYAQHLTLAQIGRLTGEHEATVSRQLARTRRDVRTRMVERLKSINGMGEAEIAECFAEMVEDAGALDLGGLLAGGEPRKDSAADRSQ